MTHPNQRTIDLILDHAGARPDVTVDAQMAFVRDFLERREDRTIDVEAFVHATRAFLTLRMAWAPVDEREHLCRSQTLHAMQDVVTTLELGYDLIGGVTDIHSMAGPAEMTDLDPHQVGVLAEMGVTEPAELGMLKTAVLHAMMRLALDEQFDMDDETDMRNVALALEQRLCMKLATGSFQMDEATIDDLLDHAHTTALDTIELATPGETRDNVMGVVAMFDIAVGMERLAPVDTETLDMAAAALTIVGLGDETDVTTGREAVNAAFRGSTFGLPAMGYLPAMQAIMDDPETVALGDQDDENDVSDAIDTIIALRCITHGLGKLTSHLLSAAKHIAMHEIRSDPDTRLTQMNGVRAIELIGEATLTGMMECEDFMRVTDEVTVDSIAELIRTEEASSDPTPPPAASTVVLPMTFIVRTHGGGAETLDMAAIREIMAKRFVLQQDDAEVASAEGVHWRLQRNEGKPYSEMRDDMTSVLRTRGVKSVSAGFLGDDGIAVTTMVRDGPTTHRLLTKPDIED